MAMLPPLADMQRDAIQDVTRSSHDIGFALVMYGTTAQVQWSLLWLRLVGRQFVEIRPQILHNQECVISTGNV
jgi:hypothetical protein